MSLGVKLLASTLGIVGGVGIVPLTLWQTGHIGNTGTKNSPSNSSSQNTESHTTNQVSLSPHSSISTEEATRKIEEAKNCIVISKDSEQEILKGLGISNKNYYVISCENTGQDIAQKWKGYFPSDIFGSDLVVGEKFEMKTSKEDESEEDNNQDEITFLSAKFSEGDVLGKLESAVKSINDQKITVVNLEGDVSDDGNVYLLFESRDNQ